MFRPHLNTISLSDGECSTAERLARDVEMLAGVIGERHVWKPEMLLAAERYIRQEMEKTGRVVQEQEYRCRRGPVRNLILEQLGERRAQQILVVGAHYDSIDGTPGADDNASAVAGLLEIARQLAPRKFQRTIRYVAFVNEEPPFYKTLEMGSLVYARSCRAQSERIIGMINLEMIGRYSDERGSQRYPRLGPISRVLPDQGNFIVIAGNVRSARLVGSMLWNFRRSVRFPALPYVIPRGKPGADMSDNWSFWQSGYPAVMVTDTSFLRNRDYHTSRDAPDTLHFPAMTRVVCGVAGAIARLAGEIRPS